MLEDTLALKLDGEIPLAAFMEAMGSLHGLVDALTNDVASGASIDWIIARLDTGSALAQIRGKAQSVDERESVAGVVHAYGIVGEALQSNTVIPFSPRVREQALKLTGVLAESRITAIRFQAAGHESLVRQHVSPAEPKRLVSYGIIEGRVLSLTSRHQLRFTLYDTIYDRGVLCYVQRGREDEVRRVWGQVAAVEGVISRDPFNGQPVVVHDIGSITVIEPIAAGAFERARGVLPRPAGASRAEEVVRRGRDAW